MEIEIKLPELGSGIKAGDVLEVLVNVGDTIERDQGLLEIETDKATVTVPSTAAGRITKVLVKRGDSVAIGSAIVVVESSAPAPATAKAPEKPAAAATPPAPKAVAPAPPAPTPPAPTPPVDSTPPAPAAATTIAPKPAPVAPAPVAPAPGSPVASPAATAVPAIAASADVADLSGKALAAGPAVRKFAREVGIDLQTVQGTGEHGRITREDVLEAVRQANQAVRTNGSNAPASSSGSTSTATRVSNNTGATLAETVGEPANDPWGRVRIEKMTKIRKTIAAKMHESWTSVPRVTNVDDADVTELERIRQTSKDDYAERGIKLTSLPFVIKSVAMALRSHPTLNASIDMENGTIIYKDYVNIGIAVDSERGLVVPSLRNADQLSIPEIARKLQQIAEMVRTGSFGVDDLRGSTFTISNLGAVGGVYSSPIVNTPEVAILLVGRSRKMPVVVDDAIVPRLMMPLSLSYDHRLVDGAAAARFLNEVIGYLNAPGRLLLAP